MTGLLVLRVRPLKAGFFTLHSIHGAVGLLPIDFGPVTFRLGLLALGGGLHVFGTLDVRTKLGKAWPSDIGLGLFTFGICAIHSKLWPLWFQLIGAGLLALGAFGVDS